MNTTTLRVPRVPRLARLLVLLAVLLVTSLAHAGSYLDRAALLLGEARRGNEWVLSHLGDKELALVAHTMAEARVRAAQKMAVPKEVAGMHPHLLLALESSERAAAAASEGENEKFLHHLRIARDEESAFRGLLAQQKLSLPSVGK